MALKLIKYSRIVLMLQLSKIYSSTCTNIGPGRGIVLYQNCSWQYAKKPKNIWHSYSLWNRWPALVMQKYGLCVCHMGIQLWRCSYTFLRPLIEACTLDRFIVRLSFLLFNIWAQLNRFCWNVTQVSVVLYLFLGWSNPEFEQG